MTHGLIEIVQGFSGRSVLVVGDVMVDEYLWGSVNRISPEAPVPVVEFLRNTHILGGAANVAANLVALEASVYLAGVVGTDPESAILRNELASARIDAHLVNSPDRPTTRKTRIMGGSQQILRVDREKWTPISQVDEDALLEWSQEHIENVHGILISDYAKGVVTPRLSQHLIGLARDSSKPVVVDPKGSDFSKYRGATAITPNVKELMGGTVRLANSESELSDLAERLISALEGTSIVLTRGPEGVSLFREKRKEASVPALVRQVFDVTGAGDTFVATLTLALAAAADLQDATQIANVAAGLVVGRLGTATVSLHDLTAEL